MCPSGGIQMNLLFCSVGRRAELIKYFKESLGENSKIIATDNLNTAPALYIADKQYIVPKIKEAKYIPTILEICNKEEIKAITTFIDPEIEILAENRDAFKTMGIEVLAPDLKSARLCFDKYEMFEFLTQNNISTVKTFKDIDSFSIAYKNSECYFPVFVKPRTGSASVGARKINNYEELKSICSLESNLIIQEFIEAIDIDVDVYIDMISKKPVSIFAKKKLETKIGGANKTISFIDYKLFEMVEEIVSKFNFNGPIDIDFFYRNGDYLISEINPRFGGAYLHAYRCGVDFMNLIVNNLNGIQNLTNIGNYDEDILMMMYDSVIIRKKTDMFNQNEH